MRKCKRVAARHILKVVFSSVGFQVLWINHPDAVMCHQKQTVYKLYIYMYILIFFSFLLYQAHSRHTMRNIYSQFV